MAELDFNELHSELAREFFHYTDQKSRSWLDAAACRVGGPCHECGGRRVRLWCGAGARRQHAQLRARCPALFVDGLDDRKPGKDVVEC